MTNDTKQLNITSETDAQGATVSGNERDFILRGILSEIKKVVTAQQFDMWFSCLKIFSINDNSITFVTPNTFVRDWLYSNYVDLFSTATYKVLNTLREIVFSSESEASNHLSAVSSSEDGKGYTSKDFFEECHTIPVNKYYSFESFIIGPSNRLAHAAAVAVSESPGHAYNPLFIHGSSGVGKTHLLHAINNVLLSKHAINTLYLSCDRFINHYISTMRSNNWDAFRRLYRNVDALLIDDIQLFENSQESREEFFHTFNTLYNARKQIVITSDCPPESIKFLEDRLVSRFKWGLLCGIDNPTLETRIAIAEKKALLLGINLSYESASYLAENMRNSIREIEGAIIRLNKETKIVKSGITLELVKKVVNALSGNRKPVTIDAILKAVSNRFNVSTSQILSKYRTRSFIIPRQVAMHLSRKLTNMSLAEIGGYIGGRDHSTVIHADEKVTKMSKKDKNLLLILQKLENELLK